MRDFRTAVRLVKKREVLVICGLSALFAVAEGFSVSLLLPIMQSIQFGEALLEASELPAHLDILRRLMEALLLPVTLGSLLVMGFVGILFRQVVQFFRAVAVARADQRITADLRSRGFAALVRSDMAFLNAQRRGELHSMMVMEAPRAGQASSEFLALVGASFLMTGYIVLLSLISPILTLVTLGTSLLTFGSMRFVLKRAWEHGNEISKLNAALNVTLTEKLSAVREVKLAHQQERETAGIRSVTSGLASHLVKLRALSVASEAGVEPIMVAAAFVTVFLAVEVFTLPLANLVMFMFVMLRMIPLMKEIFRHRTSMSGHIGATIKGLDTIAQAEAAHEVAGGSKRFEGIRSEIEFDRVGFTYSNNGVDSWALDEVSMVIPRGTMTAIVGKSGSGKSTLVNLIPRLYDVTRGQIRLDGVPVQEFELGSLRRAIGFVSQDFVLFNESVFDNLTYGLTDVAHEAVAEAAKRAYAYDFIQALPQGFDTLLGDRGVRLSVGQRQRLIIARAVLQDPHILILDEPTSALDSESEQRIQEAVDELREKTIIVIAHRLSTVKKADKILVLDDGRLVEEGTHEELLTRDGAYRRLFDLQMIHA